MPITCFNFDFDSQSSKNRMSYLPRLFASPSNMDRISCPHCLLLVLSPTMVNLLVFKLLLLLNHVCLGSLLRI